MKFILYSIKINDNLKINQLFPSKFRSNTNNQLERELIFKKLFKDTTYIKNYNWRLVHVELIELKKMITFKLAKLKKIEISKLEEGDIVTEDIINYPHTYVTLDYENQVLAIGTETKLAVKNKTIAKALLKLLNDHTTTKANNFSFEINPMINPDEVIQIIHDAYAIKKLSIKVGKSNYFDTDELITKPAQKLVDELDANEAKLVVTGDDLDRSDIEEFIRNQSARGGHPSFSVQETESSKPKKIELQNNIVDITLDTKDNNFKKNIITKMREIYNNIRKKNGKE